MNDSNGQVVVANDVSRRYGEGDAAVDALVDVSTGFQRGRFTAIMGPSGSGKSTLMHILAGLDKPTSGTVVLDGDEITSLDDGELTKLRRDKLGFVFQFFNLLPVLTAEENLVLPLSIAGRKPDERLARPAGPHRRPRGPPHPPALRALRRPAAARRRRPRPGLQTGRRLRRRADRQPRLESERRRPAPAAPGRRRVRPDGDHGHPRPGRRRPRRPPDHPARRPASSTTTPPARPTT